ncbi:bile acid:sodium symporter family protein [Nocardia asteroides NBRC 15531]|nr:bile acid:sodium symporter family protein [Nocardia asteroides]TLF69338.1 bile acid:sodium symporter family protein [Nocardia asteroides NBRC 15531]UGT48832.1 bile acid:sodium symporter family protein [Nocardia asteroides]SFL72163.1 bile acid:Na+ symporter, BASS family [Nocardia asteroides]VEG31406.1 bile acid transporter [Nocardia asteroides]
MGSSNFAVVLPLALVLVMFGLGLTLTPRDFQRVIRHPKAAAIALVCQLVLLPAVCLLLVVLFGLTGVLAVGMMLLVASPGGTSANLFSHLAGGDVALNIVLTAINSVIAAFTMPIVIALSVTAFLDDDASVGLQTAKLVQVTVVVLVPVAVGMWTRHRFPGFAERMGKPVKIGSMAVLVMAVAVAVGSEFDTLRANFGRLGLITLLLSVLSLAIGYFVPRWFGIDIRQAIASAMEIGIHNATLAIAVAVSALGSEAMAVPAATYGIVMGIPAAIAAYLLARRAKPTTEPTDTRTRTELLG